MKLQIPMLILALSFSLVGCAGYQAAMEKIEAQSNDMCRRQKTHSQRPIWGLQLPQSGTLVCTDTVTARPYEDAIMVASKSCEPDCFRDLEKTEYSSSMCAELTRIRPSLESPYREKFLGRSYGAVVGLNQDVRYYPVAMQGIVALSSATMLDFEMKTACVTYRAEVAAAKTEAQAIAAEEARQKAIKQEAERKIADAAEAKRKAERQTRIFKVCPGGWFDFGKLLFANPYDVKDKCYNFTGTTVQIMSRSTGLYKLGRDGTVYIDFSPEVAPNQVFQGYVKGIGVYTYTSVRGAQMNVPHLVSTQIPD